MALQRPRRVGAELGEHRFLARWPGVVAEHVVDAHGFRLAAFRLTGELGLEAFGEARAGKRFPRNPSCKAAHRVARGCFERRKIHLALLEPSGDCDRQAPARGVAVSRRLLGLPWLADHGGLALRHAADDSLYITRAHAAL